MGGFGAHPLPSSQEFRQAYGHAAGCDHFETIPVVSPQLAERPVAMPQGLFQHCVEDRREIAGGRIVDLQYLASRGLLSERLVTFGSALRKLLLQLGYDLLRIG